MGLLLRISIQQLDDMDCAAQACRIAKPFVKSPKSGSSLSKMIE
jgi:hypothetical protein